MVEEFLKYTANFDKTDDRVSAKIAHTMRVRAEMLNFANELGFDENEIELATEIGLLHDIGRFEQAKVADSFNDLKGFDHADFGADLLFKDGLIENFGIKKSHYPIIEYAIRQHNKLHLKDNGDNLTMKMSKLIRDVDKLDILYNLGTLGRFDLKADDSEISPLVKEDILNDKTVDRKNVVTNNDKITMDFALVYDLNYSISYKIAKDRLQVLYERVENKDTFKNIYKHVVKFIDERINELC